jgi:hypothetical protein
MTFVAFHMERRRWAALLLIFGFALVPPSAWGWGREGHQMVAAVAEDHLDETTKVMIQSLIGNNHLYSIATWADDVRKEWHDTTPWHYAGIPLGTTYEANGDCSPPNSCVVVRIAEFVRVLTDQKASREDRAEALKFVVHFVGDIHQPMHAVGEVKDGNGVRVKVGCAEQNVIEGSRGVAHRNIGYAAQRRSLSVVARQNREASSRHCHPFGDSRAGE